jgi:hypothetical protein
MTWLRRSTPRLPGWSGSKTARLAGCLPLRKRRRFPNLGLTFADANRADESPANTAADVSREEYLRRARSDVLPVSIMLIEQPTQALVDPARFLAHFTVFGTVEDLAALGGIAKFRQHRGRRLSTPQRPLGPVKTMTGHAPFRTFALGAPRD